MLHLPKKQMKLKIAVLLLLLLMHPLPHAQEETLLKYTLVGKTSIFCVATGINPI
jgi:hypothetical protein